MIKYSFLLPYYNRKKYIKATLDSFRHFYGDRQDFEVIICDDVSSDEHRLEDLVIQYDFSITLSRLSVKDGINPCVPYNVAARKAIGEYLVLTSPETLHTSDILTVCEGTPGLSDSDYFVFSVFCPTNEEWNKVLLGEMSFDKKLDYFNSVRHHMYDGLGEGGRPLFNSKYGSWYLHAKHRPSSLNFLTVIRKDIYFDIGGFREEFRNGTGYDDDDFLDRLKPKIRNVKYFDAEALHLNHKPVHSGNPTSNYDLYLKLKVKKEY